MLTRRRPALMLMDGLVSHERGSNIKWVKITHNSTQELPSPLPKNAVAGGVTAEGEMTYVARAATIPHLSASDMTYGDYVPSQKRIPSVSEHPIETCDILVCHDPDILHWVDGSYGQVPANAIAETIAYGLDDKIHELIYIARTRPGHFAECEGRIMCFGLNGSDSSSAPLMYQVLCAYLPPPLKYLRNDSPYTWVPASDGYIPENGLIGGKIEDRESIYLARACEEDFYVGYVVPSEKVCHYLKYGDPKSSSSYEVLVPSNPSHFHWSTEFDFFQSLSTPNNKHHKVIVRTNEPPTIQGPIVGNLVTIADALVTVQVSYKGKLVISTDRDYCEALIVDKVPNSLQELCRYVILDSTSGVPNRINGLPLPKKVKDYCQLRSEETTDFRFK